LPRGRASGFGLGFALRVEVHPGDEIEAGLPGGIKGDVVVRLAPRDGKRSSAERALSCAASLKSLKQHYRKYKQHIDSQKSRDANNCGSEQNP